MARLKNSNWNCGPDDRSGNAFDVDHAILAALLDLRDELQQMNSLLRAIEVRLKPLHRLDCPNFLRIPRKLDRIGRNTERKKKKGGRAAA